MGAFGKVYRVKNKVTNEYFAIKILNVTQLLWQQLVSQVQNEIMILARCSHENVIKIRAVFQEDNDFCLLMELSEGNNLFKILQERKKLSEEEVMIITLQITKALHYLHSQSPPIIHRDLKPENVLYNKGVVKLIDFGWSNLSEDFRNTFCGTPEYLCPEMIQGIGHTEKLDIWTLGILAYELAVGKTPFAPKKQEMDPRTK